MTKTEAVYKSWHTVKEYQVGSTNCSSVFDHFVGLALKGLKIHTGHEMQQLLYHAWHILPHFYALLMLLSHVSLWNESKHCYFELSLFCCRK